MKCIIANYGSNPVFRVSVQMFIEWKEEIKADNGTKSGNVIRSGIISSPSFDLGVSSKNEDYFYIVNLSDAFVNITPSDTGVLYTANSDTPHVVKLIPPNSPFPPMFLGPRPSSPNPPIVLPAVPMPPNKPRGK
jgi:hypothetical protein